MARGVVIIGILALGLCIVSILFLFKKEKSKGASIFAALSTLCAILLALASNQIQVPDIYPLSHELTSEHPAISILDYKKFYGKIYYSTDPYTSPVDSGIQYTGEFIPSESRKYFFQSVFLTMRSSVVTYEVITAEDNLRILGEQDGNTNETADRVENAGKDIDWGTTAVSQEQALDYYDLPDGFASGWGDNSGGRTSYTLDEINEGKINDQIIFNTISDSVIGDEKNFVAARENTKKLPGETYDWKGNLINVEIGKEYLVRIYGHNNSPKGYDRIAEDVAIQFQIPGESGRSIAVHGLIFSSNAVPSLYWDGVVFTCETPFRLEYVQGSAKIRNNGIGSESSALLSDSIVNNWVTIGYNELNGRIPGCYQYAFYASIRVKVVAVNE